MIDYSARGLGIDDETAVFRAVIEGGAAPRNSGSVALILAQMTREAQEMGFYE